MALKYDYGNKYLGTVGYKSGYTSYKPITTLHTIQIIVEKKQGNGLMKMNEDSVFIVFINVFVIFRDLKLCFIQMFMKLSFISFLLVYSMK